MINYASKYEKELAQEFTLKSVVDGAVGKDTIKMWDIGLLNKGTGAIDADDDNMLIWLHGVSLLNLCFEECNRCFSYRRRTA